MVTCSKCQLQHLSNAHEFRCCSELTGILTGKKTGQCITSQEDFAALLHKSVLTNAAGMMKDREGKVYRRKPGKTENEFMRAVAYRWITRYFWGFLGRDNTRPLSACIYNYIRDTFPGQNTGFQ